MTGQSVKRDVNDISTWVYPDIPSGVTVIRKKNVTEDEIYEIYKECIVIQRNAYIQTTKNKYGKSQSKEFTI